MWGGIEIYRAAGLGRVEPGDADHGRRRGRSTGTQQARHRLIVKGVVIMGGVDIRLAPE